MDISSVYKHPLLLRTTMPHAVSVTPTGFQALILCGPGASLTTFTANPEEFPKALIPIANRPMVWYPLNWCYRMGITRECSCSLIAVLSVRLCLLCSCLLSSFMHASLVNLRDTSNILHKR